MSLSEILNFNDKALEELVQIIIELESIRVSKKVNMYDYSDMIRTASMNGYEKCVSYLSDVREGQFSPNNIKIQAIYLVISAFLQNVSDFNEFLAKYVENREKGEVEISKKDLDFFKNGLIDVTKFMISRDQSIFWNIYNDILESRISFISKMISKVDDKDALIRTAHRVSPLDTSEILVLMSISKDKDVNDFLQEVR